MIRKCHKHTLKTNPRHHEEETQNTNSAQDTRKTTKAKQPALFASSRWLQTRKNTCTRFVWLEHNVIHICFTDGLFWRTSTTTIDLQEKVQEIMQSSSTLKPNGLTLTLHNLPLSNQSGEIWKWNGYTEVFVRCWCHCVMKNPCVFKCISWRSF